MDTVTLHVCSCPVWREYSSMCMEGTVRGEASVCLFQGFPLQAPKRVLRYPGSCLRHQQLSWLTFPNPSGPAQHSGCCWFAASSSFAGQVLPAAPEGPCWVPLAVGVMRPCGCKSELSCEALGSRVQLRGFDLWCCPLLPHGLDIVPRVISVPTSGP